MENIIINTKNVKDYKFNVDNYKAPYSLYKILHEFFLENIDKLDIINIEILSRNNYNISLLKIKPSINQFGECGDFIPFVMSIFHNQGIDLINSIKSDFINIENFYYSFIPKKRNSVINGLPIFNYSKNWECRVHILENYFPDIINKMDFFIGNPNSYKTDREYCIALDESWNLITGEDTGVPKPEPDLSYLINYVRKLC